MYRTVQGSFGENRCPKQKRETCKPMLTVMRIYNSVKTKKTDSKTVRIVLSGISFDERHNPTVLGLTKLIRTCAVSQYTEGFTHIAMTSTNL